LNNQTLEFVDEQNRVIVNLQQHYEVWMDATRRMRALPYGMKWKTVGARDYLYEIRDRDGNGISLGVKSDSTERTMFKFKEAKQETRSRVEESARSVASSCAQYRALRLPLIAPQAAEILREADQRSLLGSCLMVVGTNAMAAYSLEATMAFTGVDVATDDFDMAWIASSDVEMTVVWPMLRAVDPTYTINTERPFQARNARAYEFELLASPSTLPALPRRDRPRPEPMLEQEWFLKGRHVEHVVVARDGSPARLVVPDPRWFALQKAWLSKQEKRNPAKRHKDARQASKLLDMVEARMLQFPLDEEFEASLPMELVPHFAAWKASDRPPPPVRRW
jgi:hypothetical protein